MTNHTVPPALDFTEAELAAEQAAETEAELADNWDSADSDAYQARVEAGLEPEAAAEPHDCPGAEPHPYPTFDDNPGRWGLRPEPPMTDAELEAAAEAEAWGPDGPYASYAEWAAEIRLAEPEAGP